MKPTVIQRGNLIPDFIAGLTTGISNIPDAMATAILAGANPVYGLYATMVGSPVGAIFGSSAFMNIAVTSAMAITVGSALTGLSGEAYTSSLFTLTLLVGLILVISGLLKLGRLVRFISNAVMIGFLTGISITIILSQLSDFTGYSSDYPNKVRQAVDTVRNLDQINPQTTAIGLLTVITIILINRTRLKNFSMLIGMLAGTIAVILFGWQDIVLVGDVATIPSSLPRPSLPDLSLIPTLLFSALAIAIICMIQGAGVSKSYANPDGSYPDVSRDYIGQGAANIVAGLFQGVPVGGSVSSTALNISSGARSRWANIFSGLVIVLAVLLFSSQISKVPMTAMAGLLIVAGAQSIKQEEFGDVWTIGWASRLVMLVTLVLTLSLPIYAAVLVGVLLSIIVYALTSSQDVRLVQILPNPDGTYKIAPPPADLPSNTVTLLEVNGNLFFGAIDNLERLMPSAKDSERPVVILRMRPYETVSSTFINFLERYAVLIQAHGGRFILAGISKTVKAQLDRTEISEETLGRENIFLATDTIGESSRSALADAQRWLAQQEYIATLKAKKGTEA